MTGLPYNPPPRGKHEDPLAPNLVMEEEKTGLAAGLPLVRDRDVWANPDALLPERHELWWDDGTAEPEWYIDRDFARPMSVPLMSAQLLGMFSLLFFGVGGLAVYLGEDNHKRAASRAEFGWPVDREEFSRVEMGRKAKGTTGYEEDEAAAEEEE